MRLKDRDRLLVGVIYRSPSSTDEDNRKLLSVISEAVNMKTSHLLIFGDFNYPGINWDTQTTAAPGYEQAVSYTHLTLPTILRV